jgi:peptidoglycan/LPS O-acetylase OafA/YrhL
MVFLYHVIACDVPIQSGGWLYALGVSTFQLWCGVDLFFVLSGFFILSTLLANEGRARAARNYFLSRFFRITPLYVFLLLGYFYLPRFIGHNYLTGLMFDTTTPNFVYLFLGQAWSAYFTHDNGAGFIGVTWSLSVEVFLYVVAAAIVFGYKGDRIRVLAGLALLSWGLRAVASLFFHSYFVCYFLPVCRMDEFMMGGIVAVMLRNGKLKGIGPGAMLRLRMFVCACLAFFVGTTLAVTDSKGEFAAVVDFAFLGVFFSAVLILVLAGGQDAERDAEGRAARGGILARVLVSPLSYLGLISYSVYIFHIPIHYLFNYFCGLDYISLIYPGAWWRLLAECLVTLVFCSLTYRLIEEPMIRFGHRYTRHQAAPLPPALGS